jgi:chorismate-pyruvate lyase
MKKPISDVERIDRKIDDHRRALRVLPRSWSIQLMVEESLNQLLDLKAKGSLRVEWLGHGIGWRAK